MKFKEATDRVTGFRRVIVNAERKADTIKETLEAYGLEIKGCDFDVYMKGERPTLKFIFRVDDEALKEKMESEEFLSIADGLSDSHIKITFSRAKIVIIAR